MRIYGVSCNAYSPNKRYNPTFGFWQPKMSSLYRAAEEVAENVEKPLELKGKEILKQIPIGGWLDNFKTRHVNIRGSQDKSQRTTFNRYDHDGITHKYEQDLYPDGDLITTVKTYGDGKIAKVEEYIENIK